ncbi:protein DddP (metallopeptidase, family M24), DMSP degrading [Phaeobacter inhibens]|nr:protein DddP (metallopeptidase, family M24), DMSP degrading [Phaeobacter inhibens]AUQ78568.1 protein DddP (metallopeptidase, family M24), DMSP degrading [Phaeobacter inhibens]AUR15727.1 protein DddP (metallopeptidase, family M24), DMSP degrading [Phaeobacter inhibens]
MSSDTFETMSNTEPEMNEHYRDTRKIDPTRGATLGDNTPNDQDRVEIGPTRLAFGEWAAAGLQLPDLQAMRRYRWERLTRFINDRDYAGLLVFDPMNIRYATDSTNMQLWNTHNPFRALLICADGYMVMWDYKQAPFLSEFNPLVREQRAGADLFYFDRGDKVDVAADVFANEVRRLLAEHSGQNTRLAVDKIMLHGLRALEAQGLEVVPGEELTEKCRAVKGPDEILAIRCANHACETAVAEMERFARSAIPGGGVSEDDVWAVLHAENIRRGGEWIETRLLTSGPRTNPWFQECGGRIIQNNEIVSFDTDLVGSYGICIDISRSWWIGDRAPPADMVYAMQHGVEHIQTNMEMLKPGVNLQDLSRNCHLLDAQFQKQKYGCMMHGVGLCDEWPLVAYPDAMVEGAFDYDLEPGMVLCVEALVSPEGGDFSIKLEDQVLITETGYENLTTYPFDPALMGTTRWG